MSKKTFKWNPEQNFGDDNNDIHVQCKLIDDLLKERLKSVSLVITTLLTSLHDTITEGMDQGFKIAIENFERITIVTNKILEKIVSIISVSSVLGLILVTHIIILIKALKQEEVDYTKVIKDLCKRWDIMETMVRNQFPENRLTRAVEISRAAEIPKAVEIPWAVELIPVAVRES